MSRSQMPWLAVCLACFSVVFLLRDAGAQVPALGAEPGGQVGGIVVSGRYPHLTMFNTSSECGIGAVVPWAERLWVITYSPHAPRGSSDKLYEIDGDLNLTARPESVGGTPANRMIHRESGQLFIGPYVIDEQRKVRVVGPKVMPGRLTGTARHLTDPAGKVYHYTMEEGLYEVDVKSLAVRTIYPDGVQKGGIRNPILPGYHGKGAYTAQGRLVVANNGEPLNASQWLQPGPSGCLASWDGSDWSVLQRHQFCEVTGPGGIYGNPPGDDRLWATGWDHRSVLLKLLDDGQWHTFRLPIGDYSYFGRHGWHTEWPRIRQVVPPAPPVPAAPGQPASSAKLLMNMHGTWLDFPLGFSAKNAGGLRPIATHLKITADFAPWRGRIVFACDDASKFNNPLVNQAHSNLWFTTWEALDDAGPRIGFGGVWVRDDVDAGAASEPFLIAGYRKRVLHLSHQASEPVTFTLQVDATGKGQWSRHGAVTVPAKGYAHHIIPPDLQAQWVRVAVDRAAGEVTAFFHMTAGNEGWPASEKMFADIADIDAAGPRVAGLVRPRGGDLGTLQVAAVHVDAGGQVSPPQQYIAGADLKLQRRMDSDKDREALAWFLERGQISRPDFTVDAASVIVKGRDGTRYRLPRTDAAYDAAWAEGWPRGIREVVTERSLLNAHGTFYVLPRDISGGVAAIKPVCTHRKRIHDFCSWRGLLVMTGCAQPSADSGSLENHRLTSDDGKVAVWVGDIDDLWRFGKPVGQGGPWRDTPVKAGAPSDPYLMAGYDRKRVDLSHDADGEVTFTVQVDPVRDGAWASYASISVPAGQTVTHHFPDGFSAHWVRVVSDQACKATATFVYE